MKATPVSTQSMAPANMERLIREAHFDDTHLWVLPSSERAARCGFDALGVETSGDVVALSFEPIGTKVSRGQVFGSIEAAKFVGPLIAPVSGTITAHNEEVLTNPGLLRQDSARHWLIELELDDAEHELPLLRHGEDDVRSWLASEMERFKQRGMIAE